MDCPHDRIEVTRNTHGAFDDHETIDGYCKDCFALVTGTVYFADERIEVRAITPALGQWRVAS